MLQQCLLALIDDEDSEDSDEIVDREAAALMLAEIAILLRRGLRKWIALKL